MHDKVIYRVILGISDKPWLHVSQTLQDEATLQDEDSLVESLKRGFINGLWKALAPKLPLLTPLTQAAIDYQNIPLFDNREDHWRDSFKVLQVLDNDKIKQMNPAYRHRCLDHKELGKLFSLLTLEEPIVNPFNRKPEGYPGHPYFRYVGTLRKPECWPCEVEREGQPYLKYTEILLYLYSKTKIKTLSHYLEGGEYYLAAGSREHWVKLQANPVTTSQENKAEPVISQASLQAGGM